jgi:predicted GNAT superfamily acetyltransferase
MRSGVPSERIVHMRHSVAIRAARIDDFPAICSINGQSLPAVSVLAPGDLNRATALATVAWVAVVDEVVSGYLFGYDATASYDGEEFAWFRSKGHDFLYVDQIAVAWPSRRRGIGAALYDAVEALAGRERLSSLACEVNVQPPNPASLAFHLRRGFVEADRIQTRDGRRVALLRKELPVSV